MRRDHRTGPLAGVRIIECSMLGPGAPSPRTSPTSAPTSSRSSRPPGDYIRQMTWPIVEGVSLMHLHINRGKRSIVLDLRTDEGVEVFLELVRGRRRRHRGDAARRPRAARPRLRAPAARSTRGSCSARSPATA